MVMETGETLVKKELEGMAMEKMAVEKEMVEKEMVGKELVEMELLEKELEKELLVEKELLEKDLVEKEMVGMVLVGVTMVEKEVDLYKLSRFSLMDPCHKGLDLLQLDQHPLVLLLQLIQLFLVLPVKSDPQLLVKRDLVMLMHQNLLSLVNL